MDNGKGKQRGGRKEKKDTINTSKERKKMKNTLTHTQIIDFYKFSLMANMVFRNYFIFSKNFPKAKHGVLQGLC